MSDMKSASGYKTSYKPSANMDSANPSQDGPIFLRKNICFQPRASASKVLVSEPNHKALCDDHIKGLL